MVTRISSAVRCCGWPCLNEAVLLAEVLVARTVDIQQLICRGLCLCRSSYTAVTQCSSLGCSATIPLPSRTPTLPPAVPSLQHSADAANPASSRSVCVPWSQDAIYTLLGKKLPPTSFILLRLTSSTNVALDATEPSMTFGLAAVSATFL